MGPKETEPVVTKVSLAEAIAGLATVADDVRRTAHRYLLERHGRRAATKSLRTEAADALRPTPAGAIALVGAWHEIEDAAIDQFTRDVARSRSQDADQMREHRQ